jgi:hypothetical protein
MDPIIPPSTPGIQQQPSELQQLRAEVAEVKELMLKIRRSQKLAVWMGVVKVLVYLGLVGAAAVALQGIMANGLGALTGVSLYGSLPSSTSPTGLDFSALIKNVQDLQNGQ